LLHKHNVFQQLLNGIGIGCTYALIALGYNLIFGVLKVVNLAYGEIFMVSAFATLFFASLLPGQPILIIIAALIVAVIIGALIHLLAVKPLGIVTDINSPRHLSVLISTLGCSLIFSTLPYKYSVVTLGAFHNSYRREHSTCWALNSISHSS